MPIPPEYAGRYVYHFCHISNLPNVLKHGLLSYNQQRAVGIQHLSIASQEIQGRRSTMRVTCGPRGVVHDYIPFYFCQRSSMLLAVVNAKNVDQMMLVYFAVPIAVLDRPDVVFTSASANTAIPPSFYSDTSDLAKLQWPLIDSLKWSLPSEAQKQARQAEALVHRRLPIGDVAFLITWNDYWAKKVLKVFADAGVDAPPIKFDGDGGHYYYLKMDRSGQSLVTGPLVMKHEFEAAVADVIGFAGKATTPKFLRLCDMRSALRAGIGNVSATAELVGLQTDNKQHTEDVGTHTCTVVQKLLQSPEFAKLDDTDKLLAEIAAYLHDVGKGPRVRWKDNNYVQRTDPDHPVGGLPIVADLLKTQIGDMKPRSAKVILKLVCYHDLVGDILGRGRDERQLYDVVEDERDLGMLMALGKADATSVRASWWDEYEAAALRARVVKVLSDRQSGN